MLFRFAVFKIAAAVPAVAFPPPPMPGTTPPTTTPLPVPSSNMNFLLLFPDEWRWDFAGFDAAQLNTPTLHTLASKGTRFTFAYVPSPVCGPSRACMASGKEYGLTGVPDNGYDFPLNQTTWYQLLQNAGYHTMTTGKDDLTKKSSISLDGSFNAKELGFSDWIRTTDKDREVHTSSPTTPYSSVLNQTTVQHNGRQVNALQAEHHCLGLEECCPGLMGKNCDVPDYVGSRDALYLDTWVASSGITLLERRPAGKPWALHVSFPGPHPPFVITETMNKSIAGRTFPTARDSTLDAMELLDIRRQYAAEVENLDTLFGQIISKVESLGEIDNTLIVVASDHGDELGDHGLFGKERPWEGSSHVPLLVSGPGVAKARVVDTPVATLDIPGTLLDLAGVESDVGMTTRSLRPLLAETGENATAYRGFVNSGLDGNFGNFRMVVKEFNDSHILKLVCCDTVAQSGSGATLGCPIGPSTIPAATGPIQVLLFNAKTDPGDMTDLSETIGTNEVIEMAALLPGDYAAKCKGHIRNTNVAAGMEYVV